MRALAALLALLVTGWGASEVDHVDLEDRWRPLARIQRDASTPRGVFRTLGSLVLTGDPRDFLARPEVEREGLLLHERHHALREQELGLAHYLRDFAASRSFRWQEERAGWELQITHDVRAGVRVDANLVADALANGYDSMIGREQALAWVLDTMARAR